MPDWHPEPGQEQFVSILVFVELALDAYANLPAPRSRDAVSILVFVELALDVQMER